MRKLFGIFGGLFIVFAISPASAQQVWCRTPTGQMVQCRPQHMMPRPPMYRAPIIRPLFYQQRYRQQQRYYRPVVASAPVSRYGSQQYSHHAYSYHTEGGGGWGSGKDMFKIAGTPPGMRIVSVNEPEKSAQCTPPHHLYRTNECVPEGGGRMTCKLGCD